MFYDKNDIELKLEKFENVEQNTKHKSHKLATEKKDAKDKGKGVLEHKDCFDAFPHLGAQMKREEAKRKGKRNGRGKRMDKGKDDNGMRYQ